MAVKKTKVNIPIIGGKIKIVTYYYEETRIWSKLSLHTNFKFSKLYLGADCKRIVASAFKKILNPNYDSNSFSYNGREYSHLINLAETYTSLYYSVEGDTSHILLMFNNNDPTCTSIFDERYTMNIKIKSIEVLAKKIELL
jgi:hypothetical protein